MIVTIYRVQAYQVHIFNPRWPPKTQDARHEIDFFWHFNIRPRWFSAHHRDRLVFFVFFACRLKKIYFNCCCFSITFDLDRNIKDIKKRTISQNNIKILNKICSDFHTTNDKKWPLCCFNIKDKHWHKQTTKNRPACKKAGFYFYIFMFVLYVFLNMFFL